MRLKVYGFGNGGKHRDNARAAQWRTATAEAAARVRTEWPTMSCSIAAAYAEDEVRDTTYRTLSGLHTIKEGM